MPDRSQAASCTLPFASFIQPPVDVVHVLLFLLLLLLYFYYFHLYHYYSLLVARRL